MTEIIKYPISTEKAVKMMESENKLVFIVSKKATKAEVKQELEKLFKVKVLSVNMMVNSLGKKKAYVRLSPENLAMDVATQLGLV